MFLELHGERLWVNVQAQSMLSQIFNSLFKLGFKTKSNNDILHNNIYDSFPLKHIQGKICMFGVFRLA